MIEMIDIVAITFFGSIIIVPMIVLAITRFEQPTSFASSIRRIGGNATAMCLGLALYGFFRRGNAISEWPWDSVVAILIGSVLALTIDGWILRRRSSRETS